MLAQLVGNVLAVLRTVKWNIKWFMKIPRGHVCYDIYISRLLRHRYHVFCDLYILVAATFVKLVICCDIFGVSGDFKWLRPVARCGNIHLTVVNWLRG